MPVSKTDFVRALQCKKMLWLDAHAPELRIIPPEVQEKLDAGNEFGDKAMSIFGEFVETTTFKEDGRLNFSAMLTKTQTLLTAQTPVICEAAFSWYGNFCAADILKKEKDGYLLYEVKNAPEPRKEFIVDLAFQSFLIKKCNLPLCGAKLILRGDPNGKTNEDEEQIERDGIWYKIVDVSKAVRATERTVSDNIFGFGKLKRKDAETPLQPTGAHCETPYRCWYYDYCHQS